MKHRQVGQDYTTYVFLTYGATGELLFTESEFKDMTLEEAVNHLHQLADQDVAAVLQVSTAWRTRDVTRHVMDEFLDQFFNKNSLNEEHLIPDFVRDLATDYQAHIQELEEAA